MRTYTYIYGVLACHSYVPSKSISIKLHEFRLEPYVDYNDRASFIKYITECACFY